MTTESIIELIKEAFEGIEGVSSIEVTGEGSTSFVTVKIESQNRD